MSNVLPLSSKPSSSPGLNSVEEILVELRAGRMVVIMDDEDRENEGDLIMAAERATPEAVAFMIRYSSGIICVFNARLRRCSDVYQNGAALA